MTISFQVRFPPHKRSVLCCYLLRRIQTAVIKLRSSRIKWTNSQNTGSTRLLKGVGLRRREGFHLLAPSLRRHLTRDLLFNMADETERNRLVAEFAGVTDVNPERAQFYLESSGWDLNVSKTVYFLESL